MATRHRTGVALVLVGVVGAALLWLQPLGLMGHAGNRVLSESQMLDMMTRSGVQENELNGSGREFVSALRAGVRRARNRRLLQTIPFAAVLLVGGYLLRTHSRQANG